MCTFDRTEVMVIAGELDGKRAAPPPPHSWAARPDTDVAIWTIRMKAGAKWTLPKAQGPQTVRTLYFFGGPSLSIGGEVLRAHAGAVVKSDEDLVLEAPEGDVEILLQARGRARRKNRQCHPHG